MAKPYDQIITLIESSEIRMPQTKTKRQKLGYEKQSVKLGVRLAVNEH